MRSIASRMSVMSGEGALSVFARARELEAQGRSIIHLELGEPDFHPGQSVIDSVSRALSEGKDRYCAVAGVPALCEEIAAYLARTRSIQVSAANIVIAPGCKIALFLAMMALLEPGDELLYPDPGFPGYPSITLGLGAVPVPFTLSARNHFQPDPAELASKITPRTRMLITNSPGNPTGTVYTDAVQRELAELAVKHDLWVLSDEIYARIIYAGEYLSMLRYPGMHERTLIIDGFSKSFAMTGWRLGYTVAPPEVVPALVMMAINTYTCVAEFTQYAAIEALRDREGNTQHMVGEFTSSPRTVCPRAESCAWLPLSATRRRVLRLGRHHGHGHVRRRTVPHPAGGRRSRRDRRRCLWSVWTRFHPLLLRVVDGNLARSGRAHRKSVNRVAGSSCGKVLIPAPVPS